VFVGVNVRERENGCQKRKGAEGHCFGGGGGSPFFKGTICGMKLEADRKKQTESTVAKPTGGKLE
jgi:hypothetical protein